MPHPPDWQKRTPPLWDIAATITIDRSIHSPNSPSRDQLANTMVDLPFNEVLRFNGEKWTIPLDSVSPEHLEALTERLESHRYSDLLI